MFLREAFCSIYFYAIMQNNVDLSRLFSLNFILHLDVFLQEDINFFFICGDLVYALGKMQELCQLKCSFHVAF